jgi:hydrogenase-4 membrane subunit HyfE
MYVDHRLNWEPHVSCVVSRVFGALSLLNRFKKYMAKGLRLYLVRILVIPIFLNSDVVNFLHGNWLSMRALGMTMTFTILIISLLTGEKFWAATCSSKWK